MKEKILNHAGFPGPVKIEDMERTSMYRDYLAQITGTTSINIKAANITATDEADEIPRPYHPGRLTQQLYGSTRVVK